MRVAVATCSWLPDLDDDGPLLLAALREAGLQADVRVWDDASVDWSGYDLVVVRSTWDYTERLEAFLAWAASVPRLANPYGVLRWNTDKRYLLDLAAAGVPVVPTAVVAPGEPFAVPEQWGGGEVVVKPAVSAGSRDTGRFSPTDPQAAALAGRLLDAGRSVLVQPYQDRVDATGETALLHLGGVCTHAVRKAALLREPGERQPLTEDDHRASITPAEATPDQLALAERALAAVPAEVGGGTPLLYARVDVVPGPDGAPLVLELELTEPSLFLGQAPPSAVARFAAAVRAAAAAHS